MTGCIILIKHNHEAYSGLKTEFIRIPADFILLKECKDFAIDVLASLGIYNMLSFSSLLKLVLLNELPLTSVYKTSKYLIIHMSLVGTLDILGFHEQNIIVLWCEL